MARKIQHKRGLEANLPQLDVAEIAFTTDSKKPFIGSADGNIEIAKKKDVDEALANKANATTVQGLSQTVNAKADTSYVDAELAKKADTTALETKADVTALETKADKEEVTTLSAQLAETVKQVNGKTPDANGNVTIDVPEVDTTNLATKTELQAVASGSPKGTYATLADLQAAVPSGDANIYLVTADGNWYYWDGTMWTAGGVYQSTGIAKGSVKKEHVSAEIPVKLTPENIVKNGNFADATSWSFALSTGTVENNELTFTASQYLGQVRQNLGTPISGHKYYVGAKVRATSGNIRLQLYRADTGEPHITLYHSGSGNGELLSGIATINTTATLYLRVIDYRSSGFDAVSMSEAIVVDLTELFGTGNEPTTAEFEDILRRNNNGQSFFTQSIITNLILAESYNKNPITANDNILPLYVKKSGTVVDVVSKYNDTKDLRVKLQKKGGNNLFDFYTLHLIDNATKVTSSDTSTGTLLNVSNTDWFAPYQVRAVNNVDGDTTSTHFTGGNHAYDGGASGTPTARTLDVSLFVDGREVTGDFSGYAHYIDLYWSNRVQATNTKRADGSGREVLQENIHLHFDGVEWKADNTIEFLEDVTWLYYYGLQCNNGAWNNGVFYHSSQNRKWNSGSVESNSGDKKCNKITLYKDGHYLDMKMDIDTGLGDKKFNTYTGYGAFTSGVKTYFNLVNGEEIVYAGDTFSFEGGYRFYSK